MTNLQRRWRGTLASALLMAAALLGAALADGASAQPAAGDPPDRVARLAELTGSAWVYSPDAGDWFGAVRNRPLTSGDRLATDPGARAELQVGSTTLRLDGGSELELLELDDEHIAVELHHGSASARVRDLDGAGDFELITDEGRFVLQRAGSYRFDRRDAKSDITVYAGLARYEGPNSGLAINAGQRAEFWIDSGGVAQYSIGAPLNDAFATWSRDRDRPLGDAGATARYVSPEMTGADELDRYGRWEQSPDYGALWIPTAVTVDWAPYSHGHWAWVRPWGWTWVDDAPWGFAPFHYGRWVYFRNNWCWTPGTRVRRPIYAPALVAWVGAPRAGVSVSVGNGPAVGWFPLGPREVYVPGYRVSSRYAHNINITHVTNVTQIDNVFANPQQPRVFENRRHPRAITVVPAGVLTERRAVAPAAAQWRATPWVREFANDAARTTRVLPAPPVAAPAQPPRGADPRAVVRAPPGAAERPAAAATPPRPGFGPRERDDAQRRVLSGGRFEPPAAPTAAPAAPAATPQAVPQPTQPQVRSAPPLAGAAPVVPPPAPQRLRSDDAERRGEPRPATAWPPRDRAAERNGRAERLPAAPAAAPQLATPQAAPPPVVVAPPDAAPTMRALPVQRGEPRRGPPPRPEAPPAATAEPRAPQQQQQQVQRQQQQQQQLQQPQLQQQQRVERRPAPVAAPQPRAVEVAPPARPVELQRPAAGAAVAVPAPPPAEVHRPDVPGAKEGPRHQPQPRERDPQQR